MAAVALSCPVHGLLITHAHVGVDAS
jgi:hypothetical protein